MNITDSEVWPADSPGEDGLTGDHQVVDGESNEDTVVAHHGGSPDHLIKKRNERDLYNLR